MSATSISMTWHTFGFDESLMVTWLSSPTTSIWDWSSCTIRTAYFWGWMFNLAQTVLGKILDDAPESTRQLCNFLLKTSKVRRNGGVWDLDLPPIRAILVGSILFAMLVGGFPISWTAWEITAVGRAVVGTALNYFKSIFWWCFNLLSSWSVMFSLVFFISSTMLYSISSETKSILDEDVESNWIGFIWVDFGEDFLPTILSLGGGIGFVCFVLECGGSSWFLLLVETGNASWSSSFGRMNSHIPCSSMISSSSICSSFKTSSSSPSDSAFVMHSEVLDWLKDFFYNV